jgi:hypothetical protein
VRRITRQLTWRNHDAKRRSTDRACNCTELARPSAKHLHRFTLLQNHGAVAGTVVAWKPVDYDNFALKLEDIGALVWLIQEKQFATGFVVLKRIPVILKHSLHA